MGKMAENNVFPNRKWFTYGKNGGKLCLSKQEVVQILKKWWENMFFVTGSGANVCKMAEKFVFYNRKWYKCGKNGGKKCFLQQEVVQMWEKWHEIVFFATGSSITMGKMAKNNVFCNRKWYKYGKNGSK
jgi:hypothetical protein